MVWEIPVFLSILSSYVIAPVLIRKIAKAPSRTRSLVWQYFFATLIAIGVAFFLKQNMWNIMTMLIMVIGVFNAFACYCQWRAVAISLSKTSLFTSGDDLIAMALGYAFLNESKFLTPLLVLGIIISVVVVLYFSYSKNDPEQNKAEHRRLWQWVSLYSIIWGVAFFLMRYFSLQGISIWVFIVGWYGGSFLGSLGVYILGGKKEAGLPLSFMQIRSVATLSVVIVISLALAYWSRKVAPITVVQPLTQVGEMILPTIIGFWYFKEVKSLSIKSKLAFAIGLIGGLIIFYSY